LKGKANRRSVIGEVDGLGSEGKLGVGSSGGGGEETNAGILYYELQGRVGEWVGPIGSKASIPYSAGLGMPGRECKKKCREARQKAYCLLRKAAGGSERRKARRKNGGDACKEKAHSGKKGLVKTLSSIVELKRKVCSLFSDEG